MNGRRARLIRDAAWQVVMQYGARTGPAADAQLKRVARRIRRHYTRTGVVSSRAGTQVRGGRR